MNFNYYESDIKKTKPLGLISLDNFIRSIKSPKPHILKILNEIKSCSPERKAFLKTKLYSFTPCVQVSESRSYKHITKFTELLILDFDKIDNAQEFKEFLFNEYEFIKLCWLSASGKGVRALVTIPLVESVEEFKKLFQGIAFYHMEQYNGFDTAPKNPVLPLFISHDPNILYREFTDVYSVPYEPIKPAPIQQFFVNQNPSRIERIILNKINRIVDNGHPQLRATAYTLGGYVSAGYIDYQSAENLIINLINSNAYLSIKPKTYIRTAKEMILKGTSQPLFLSK